MHSALCAAFGLSGSFKSIANAVNLRNRLSKPIGDRFGTFATTIYATLRTRPRKDFWEVARHYQKQFERHLQNLNGWVMLLLAMPARFNDEFEREPMDVEKDANALIISNVGDLNAYGAIALGKLRRGGGAPAWRTVARICDFRGKNVVQFDILGCISGRGLSQGNLRQGDGRFEGSNWCFRLIRGLADKISPIIKGLSF